VFGHLVNQRHNALQTAANRGIHPLQIGPHQAPDLLQGGSRASWGGWRELQHCIQLPVSPKENVV
jgi:hypothetical protein